MTFREYRFQRFIAYCLSEFNSAKKKNREGHSAISHEIKFYTWETSFPGDLHQRLFCTYKNTQEKLASIDAVENGETHVTAPELHSVTQWGKKIINHGGWQTLF